MSSEPEAKWHIDIVSESGEHVGELHLTVDEVTYLLKEGLVSVIKRAMKEE